MNKQILLIASVALTLLTSYTSLAQSELESFENKKNVNSVIVNKKMFEMMTNVKIDASSEEDKSYFELIKKLDNLKVFNTKNTSTRKELLSTAHEYVSNANLKEILTQNEDGYSVSFYVNKEANKNEINHLVMINEGNQKAETVIMLISGNFSLYELSTLTKKMNLPGTKSINKPSE